MVHYNNMEHFESKSEEARQFAETLRDIDERHGRTTQRGIKEYEAAFDTTQDELLKGEVLNIGDPLARLPGDFQNVVSLDYFYGTDVREYVQRLEALEKEGELDEQKKKTLELYRNWIRQTSSRVEKGAKAVKGVFPLLPFKEQTFDRVISLNAISMHPFDELGGFTEREWKLWWEELLRVLKPGGKAYVGPFDRLSEHETWLMKQKLREMQEQGLLHFNVAENKQENRAPWIGPDYVVIERPDEQNQNL